jgi:opacity protein-like surface antigen
MAILVACGSGASAQTPQPPNLAPSQCSDTFTVDSGLPDHPFGGFAASIATVSSAVNSVIGTVNTSFIAQGNAFVAGLPNPQVDQTSGGIWGRVVGGRLEEFSAATFTGNGPTPGQVACQSGVRSDYSGFQIGQDIARLNIGGGGATLHVGVTGGYAEVNAQNQGGGASPFTGNFEVPFAGVYAAYTNGGFFADITGRGELYQMTLSSADAALSNQRLNAVGGTVSGSAGYHFDLGKNWFVEPSVGGIYSKVNIDTLNIPGGFGSVLQQGFTLPAGSLRFSPDESILGRLGVRVGTALTASNVVWQPFATVSVWHEFAGNATASFTTDSPAFSGNLSNTRVGTYGQYSVGLAAQVVDAPLAGYLRLDYRNGSNIEATGFNGGLRYNFDPVPGLVKPVGIFKAPVQTAALYDWTGFYAGAFTGMGWGSNDWFFPQAGSVYHPRMSGALLGGNVGYNRQFGPWVLGVEGDVAATNAKGGQSCLSQPDLQAVNVADQRPGQNCNNDLYWMATATAKAGYAWDRVLLYGKAGGAWTENKLDVSCNSDANSSACPPRPAVPAQNFIATINQLGWTAGIGFELALTPAWSAKAEYDYMNFGTKNVVLPNTTPVNLKQDFNEVKVGVNYHFGKDDVAVASIMPVKAPTAPVFNWTGVYVGGAIADRNSFDKWQTSAIANRQRALAPFPLPPGPAPLPDPTTNPASFFSSNVEGRLYSGYNWQLSPKWVTGIEGDVGWGFGNSQMGQPGIPGTFGNGSNNFFGQPGLGGPATDAQFSDSVSVKMGWDSTIRGKLGMLVTPTILFYGTGGVAFQEVQVSATCVPQPGQFPGIVLLSDISWCGSTPAPARSQTFSSLRTGWTAGFGVEGVLVGNWLGRFEARYADFGNYRNTFFQGTGFDVATNVHVQTLTALAGVSYKFDPLGLLAAKY